MLSDIQYLMPIWWPWLGGAFLLAALVLGWRFVSSERGGFSLRVRIGLWLVRTLAGCLVLLAILDWRKETTHTEEEMPALHVLLDDSLSMAQADSSGGQTRHAAALAHLKNDLLPNWKGARRPRVGRVAEGYRDGLPAENAAQGRRSNLAVGLRETMSQYTDEPLGGVVLFTDGAASDAAELEEVIGIYREAGVPVFPWLLGKENSPADARLLGITIRQPSPSRPDLRLEARIESPGYGGKETTLLIRQGDQELHRQLVVLEGGPQLLEVDFVSPYRGLHFYTVELVPLDGEATRANNKQTAACELRREPIRVLYMEGSVPEETDFLKDGLEADPEIEVYAMHFPGASSLQALASQARRVRGKDMRIFRDLLGRDVPSVCHTTRGYPQTLEALLKFDVVIFSDIIKEAYSQEQLDATVAFVESFGGGFIMIGGMTSFGAGDYQKTVIDKLMPIEVADNSDPISLSTGVAVTDTGLQHPVMQVGENAEETKRAWATGFPGFSGFNYVRRAKPGAFTLARTSINIQEEPSLLIAVQQIGRGRTMAFTSDTTRDWGTLFQTRWGPNQRNNDHYRKFWNNTIRWLAADRIARKTGGLVIEASFAQSVPDETVRIRIPAESPTSFAGLNISATLPDGETKMLTLQWSGSQRAWLGEIVPSSIGEWIITAEYRNSEGTPVATRIGVSVSEDTNEAVAVAANPKLMQDLANGTVGQMIDASQIGEVLDRIHARSLPLAVREWRPLWNHWWILLPLIALISFEWLLRRNIPSPQQ